MSINGAQSVILQKGTIEFKNHFKQIPVSFKFYADFEECWKLWRFYSKEYHGHIPCSFVWKLICVDDRFSRPIVVFEGKNAAFKFIEAILKESEYCKNVTKNILTNDWSWLKKKNKFNQATRVGFV